MKEKLSIGKRKLLEYLGDEYTTKIIDGGLCVYIDLRVLSIRIEKKANYFYEVTASD